MIFYLPWYFCSKTTWLKLQCQWAVFLPSCFGHKTKHRRYYRKIGDFDTFLSWSCSWGYLSRSTRSNFVKDQHIYLPSEQNIESLEVASSEARLLTEEVYEGVVNVLREVRDLCMEVHDNGVDLVTEETDCFDNNINSVVCADYIALSTTCTSWGRSIRPPRRLELYLTQHLWLVLALRFLSYHEFSA